MGQALRNPTMSFDAYLAWEAAQPGRWEFLGGEVWAMAGGEDRHNTVALNVAVASKLHLRGGPCRVYGSDVKLRAEAADAAFCPDVMVTCSARDAADRLVKREPILVVEVLSPSTEAFDRGAKFAAYRTIPTLREVLFVDLRTRRCDRFTRAGATDWLLQPSAPGDGVGLVSVDLAVDAASLWADLDDDADAATAPASPTSTPDSARPAPSGPTQE